MRETEDEIVEIKREIIESRGLIIRTNNLFSSLSADLKLIAKRQQDYERRIAWNSATAYIVFVILAFGALKLAWDARVAQIRTEVEGRNAENERLKKELKDARKREDDRSRAEARAFQFYELVRSGKKREAIDSWGSLKRDELSRTELASLEDDVFKLKAELALQYYLQALEKMKLGKYTEASTTLEEALLLKEDGELAPQIRLAWADCLRKLGKQKDAILLLQQVMNDSNNREVQDDALYMLAWCQSELLDWNGAKESLRAFLKQFPGSPHYAEGKMYMAQWNLIH